MQIQFRLSCTAFMAVLLVLTGCTLNQTPPTPVYEIVTAEPSATPPGPTPTPTTIPTPTIVPEIALADGDQAFLIGDYEGAIQEYESVLGQQNAPSNTRAAAAFRTGQAALREGRFEQAAQALSIVIDDYPDNEQAAQAHLLRGDARMGLAQWSDALADYRTFLTLRPGLIDDYVYERLADAQLVLGQQADALASYEEAAAASRSLDSLIALRERIAQIYRSAGDHQSALAQYEAILAVAQTDAQRASAEMLAANTLLNADRTEEAMNHMRRIFMEYPEQPEAYDAMQALIANGFEPDALEQASVAYQHGDYLQTISLLHTFTMTHTLDAVPPDLYLTLGRAYREIGSSAAAVTTFQTLVAQYPQDPMFGEALLEQGFAQYRSGNTPAAIQQYIFIADNYGYLPEAAEALLRGGYLYAISGQDNESRAVLQRLADDYPNTAQARRGLFLGAAQASAAGDLSGAEVLYGQLAASTTGDDQAAAFFAAARLALQRGDQRTAQNAFEAAGAAAPDSYFATRTAQIALGQNDFTPPTNYRFEFDDAAAIAEAESWLREKFSILETGNLSALPENLQTDPRLLRGQALWEIGAFQDAGAEFDALVDAYRDDGLASFQLAVHMRDIGAYPQSIVAAANVIRAANSGTLDAPAFIARLRYPIYYADVVVDQARQVDLDPLLMFALIRQESLFNAADIATTGEIGLMHLLPVTGESIANELSWPDFQQSILLRPNANITFGAHALSDQMQAFDGNVIAALAAYNTSTARTQEWLAISGSDPDLFMTTITDEATRSYVQRLSSYYAIYKALYGTK